MIPFVDLQAQYRSIKREVDEAVLDVFANAQFVLGPQVTAFERLFAEYVGSTHALGVNSGTSALHLALLASGIGRGDEVITTPMSFIATASAIDYTGATPVFVDIDPITLNIDPNRLEDAITPLTKAIVPVHLHGLPADLDPIMQQSSRHDLVVIEDAAQSHGAEYRGRRVGSVGHIGCFSFYPGKNLGAYGEAGAIVTDDATAIRTMSMLRDWGCEERYHHELKGYNYRMEGVQGAVLRVKMAHIERWTESRRRLAKRYDEQLAAAGFRTPASPADRRHVYHVYAIRTIRRAEMQAFLLERGISTNIHYPIPIHLQKAFCELGHRRGDFPVAEAAADELLSLPLYPEMTEEQQDVVIAALVEWADGERARVMRTYEKVFVTGGCGLIGSHIVDLLVEGQAADEYGDIVVYDDLTRGCLDNVASATARGHVSVVEGDIRDVAKLESAMDGADLVFHLAAIRITQCAEDPRLAFEVLGEGTFNVVDTARRMGTRRIVASSSASIYGMADVFPTGEGHHPYNNRTLYGALKSCNEGLLRAYYDMYGLDYVALRYFNVYGPRMDVYGKYTEVLIRWMDRILAGEPPVIFGDGRQTMDFIHVADIARANILAAHADVTDDVFNIACGAETSLNDLAALLCIAMGSDAQPEYTAERSVNPVPRRLADISRARDLLGFTAQIDLEDGLRDLVQWWSAARAQTSQVPAP